MEPRSLFLLFGENHFDIQTKLNQWKTGFIQKYGGDINIDELEGSKPAHEIVEAAYALPFLGEKRLVIVKGFFKEQKAEGLKLMAKQLEEIPPSCVLIFIEYTAPDKRTALFKKIQTLGRLEEYKLLIGEALIQWIIRKVETRNKKIAWETAVHLSNSVGNNQWKLHNEIEKLIQYTDNDWITPEAIDEIIQEGSQSTSIFKLTDALGHKKTKEGLKILHQLVDHGEELPMIFAMLVRQFRLLIQAQELQEMKLSAAEIAKRLKQHPYAISSILPQCKNFTPQELKIIYQKLLKIDHDLKTGEIRYQNSDPLEYLLQIEKWLMESCS